MGTFLLFKLSFEKLSLTIVCCFYCMLFSISGVAFANSNSVKKSANITNSIRKDFDQSASRTASKKQDKLSPIKFDGEKVYPEPLQIYVSLDRQKLTVYRGLERIHSSNISSGKKGHATPRGIFSVLEKRKHHRSNIYNASMPYMQRLTWSGIALHQSNKVPKYPASHGCIRIPRKFAKKLYGVTSYRDHVIISPESIVPRVIEHPALFQPQNEILANFDLRENKGGYDFFDSTIRIYNDKPLRIYITRKKPSDIVKNIQISLKQLLLYEDDVDGAFGEKTKDAIVEFQALYGFKKTGRLDKNFRKELSIKSERPMLRDGVVLVRQNHMPIYKADIDIAHPTQPLGSHFLVTSKFNSSKTKWIGSSISTKIPRSVVRFNDIELNGDKRVVGNIQQVLSRLKLSKIIKYDIERMLTSGTSLAISDNGIGTETGRGTDFIVQTH